MGSSVVVSPAAPRQSAYSHGYNRSSKDLCVLSRRMGSSVVSSPATPTQSAYSHRYNRSSKDLWVLSARTGSSVVASPAAPTQSAYSHHYNRSLTSGVFCGRLAHGIYTECIQSSLQQELEGPVGVVQKNGVFCGRFSRPRHLHTTIQSSLQQKLDKVGSSVVACPMAPTRNILSTLQQKLEGPVGFHVQKNGVFCGRLSHGTYTQCIVIDIATTGLCVLSTRMGSSVVARPMAPTHNV